MAWNHKSRIVAMAIAIQTGAGVFNQPNTSTDIVGVASPTNTHEPVTADDPTATGTAWESNRVYLGKTATLGATIPMRGPGGAAPPALNAFVPGRVLQAGGFAEIRKAAANTAVALGGSTSSITLAATESATNNFLLGAPVQHAAFGSGFLQTSMVSSYDGATKIATLAETVTAPTNGTNYTIPAYLSYVLGPLTGAPIYLSVSVWRDKKRYDYRDVAPSSIAINVPVANEANTSFGDITFQAKGLVEAIVDDSTPVVPAAILNVPIAPARGGKFYLDRVKLGHQQVGFTATYTVAGASNQNQAAGQDAYDLISGSRQVSLDLNQMAVSDFDLHGREDAQTYMPLMSTWGLNAGNRFGLMMPNICLDPLSTGDRNGYVSLTGNAYPTDVDKSVALTIWW